MVTKNLTDINKMLNPQNNRIKYVFIKSMCKAMARKNMLDYNQEITFNEEKIKTIWELMEKVCESFFDLNYNRKSDFESFAARIIDSLYKNKELYFITLFCPGYTKYGYKSELGFTTRWKLKELNELRIYFNKKNITTKFLICYSDVFLENCNENKCENWKNELLINKKKFEKEAMIYFEKKHIISARELNIFNENKCITGYIDELELAKVKKTTYDMFLKYNQKFYNTLGFSNQEQKERNEKLITMYRIFSDYINKQENAIFLPMENMYERENIFSENKTCTMYLNLKNGEKYEK